MRGGSDMDNSTIYTMTASSLRLFGEEGLLAAYKLIRIRKLLAHAV